MDLIWGILLGLAGGVIIMGPLVRWLLRRAELRARQAERRARGAERLAELGSMTSGLAHEIKNPLSTVGLNAQLLHEGVEEADLPEDQRSRLLRRLESLKREVERLGGILTDFLQFAGRVQLDPQPHDVVQLVDELSDFYHPQCDQAGIVLRTDLPACSFVAAVDETLLKQAVLNLMINATHAVSPAGKPPAKSHALSAATDDGGEKGELILRVEGDDEEVRIHVIDTGEGIQPDKMAEIFHPYVTHKSGGTGLGLPTSRRIIEEHGGRLEAHSMVGQGSDFVIHLPLARE